MGNMSTTMNSNRRTTKARRQTPPETSHAMECEDAQEAPVVLLAPEMHTDSETPQDSHEASEAMDCSHAEESVSMQPGVTPGEGVGVSQSSSGSSANAGRLTPSQPLTPLERAAFDENSSLAAKLVKKGANVNQPSGSRGETPLHTAAYYNNEKMAKILLKLGADPNIGDIDGLTPFDFIIMTGCPSMLQLFMKFGANPDSPDGARLIHAIKYSPPEHRLANVKSLVEKGACVNRADTRGVPVFCYAVNTGSVPLVEYFLANGADVDGTIGSGEFTPLREAIFASSLPIAELLLDRGATVDLDTYKMSSVTPLYIAMAMNKPDFAELLLRRGADPNHVCFEKKPIIVWATKNDYRPVVELLLQHGITVDPNVKCDNGTSLITYAMRYGYEALQNNLLERGANLATALVAGLPFFAWAVESSIRSIVEYLLKLGIKLEQPPKGHPSLLSWAVEYDCPPLVEDILRNDPHIKLEEMCDSHNMTVFNRAADKGSLEIVKMFLAYNVDVNSRDKFEYTALMRAAQRNHPDVVAVLLENGADPNLKATNFNRTALYCSIYLGKGSSVKLLLDNGADAKCMSEGVTPLHVATEKHNHQAASLLLASGADPTCLDKDGNTPGVHAVKAHDLAMVELLLVHGIRADSEADKYGSTLIDMAISKGQLDMVVLLLESRTVKKPLLGGLLVAASSYGHLDIVQHLLNIKVNVNRSSEGWNGPGFTSLMAAAKFGHPKVVELLVGAGADVNKADARQLTAFDYAMSYKYPAIATYLLDHGANIACTLAKGGFAIWLICGGHCGDLALLDRLLATGTSVNAYKNEFGYTALMCTAGRYDLTMMKRLVKRGANINARNNRQQSAFNIVMEVYQKTYEKTWRSRSNERINAETREKTRDVIEYLKSLDAAQ